MLKPTVNVIGGGLAGSEAAYQLASRGFQVTLFEMRPKIMGPAHKTDGLAELVCSNTFKSLSASSAPGIFKNELSELGSLIVQLAPRARVPAGEALAVDRVAFSREVSKALLSTRNVERISICVDTLQSLPSAKYTIVATGPLTQGKLADLIKELSGGKGLYFYDAIAPVISADSIDRSVVFSASRYGKGTDDYLNCPMTKEEYLHFYETLIAAEKVSFKDFEEAKYFQGCQPIEAIAETGVDSPRFGPMKPVGLIDPRTGQNPYAVVQLRIDDLNRSSYNLVGFQTKLKYGEQSRVFKTIPGLENAEFLRLGSMHRNTYICSPEVLNHDFSLKKQNGIFFAGQITGVEGYTESSATGLMCAMAIVAREQGLPWELPPRASMLGGMANHVFFSDPNGFQPMNVNFGVVSESLFEIPKSIRKKSMRREHLGLLAVANISQWRDTLGWRPNYVAEAESELDDTLANFAPDNIGFFRDKKNNSTANEASHTTF